MHHSVQPGDGGATWPFASEVVGDPAGPAPAQPDGVGPPTAPDLPLVPYHRWAERGPSTMRVFVPTTFREETR